MDTRSSKFDGPWKKPSKAAAIQGSEARLSRTKAAAKRKQQRMNKQADKRKEVGYEANTPRCAHCIHFKPAGIVLFNSVPQERGAACRKHGFPLRNEHGCCDTWAGQDGSTLEN